MSEILGKPLTHENEDVKPRLCRVQKCIRKFDKRLFASEQLTENKRKSGLTLGNIQTRRSI